MPYLRCQTLRLARCRNCSTNLAHKPRFPIIYGILAGLERRTKLTLSSIDSYGIVSPIER